MTNSSSTLHAIEKRQPAQPCQLLPRTARELLLTAANTPDKLARPKVLDNTIDLIRKTWPEYFYPVA